jgi:hypothetical protein
MHIHVKCISVYEMNVLCACFQIVFSDEKKFNLDRPDSFNCYWKDLRKEPYFFSKHNFGGGTYMVLGAVSSLGTLQLAFTTACMDSAEYIQVLENHLLLYLRRFHRIPLVYQQDNAAIHRSNATKAWFNQCRIELLEWPVRSPDCNPMENVWAIPVRRVYANNKCTILWRSSKFPFWQHGRIWSQTFFNSWWTR